MAGKVRHHFEPWVAERAPVGAPPQGEPDPDDPFSVQVFEAHERVARDADWLVLGSGMVEPCVCTSLLGKPTVMGDRRPVATVGKLISDRGDGAPSKEEVARRIVRCVNACEG